MNAKKLAEKIWDSGDLFKEEEYSLTDLFFIRDCLLGLKKYNLHDQDLLDEVFKFLEQRVY